MIARSVRNPEAAGNPRVSPARRGGRAARAALRRNSYTIAFILPLSLILGILATVITTPRYRAEASVQLASLHRAATKADGRSAAGTTDAARDVRTQIDVLRSRALRLLVAQRLDLLRGDEFIARMHDTSDAAGSNEPAERTERVLALLKDRLSIEPVPDTSIARVRFTSPNPVLAARVANGFAQGYILFDLQRRYETAAFYRHLLDGPLAAARDRLDRAERALGEDERRGSEAGSESRALLEHADREYEQARAERIAAQRRRDATLKADPMNLPEIVDNRRVQRLVERREDARADYRKLRRKADAEPAKLRRGAARIAALDEEVAATIKAVSRPIGDAYDEALRRERASSRKRDDLEREVARTPKDGAPSESIRREANTSRALYEDLLRRYRAAGDAGAPRDDGPSIVDTAAPPRSAISPRPFRDLAIALVLGLAVAGVLIAAREIFDDLIRSPEDARDGLGLNVLAAIPRPSGARPLAEALADRRSRISEAYHMLRTSLDLSGPYGVPRSLLFTSSRPFEGKSTSTVAIAQEFARTGRNVLLIDADLRDGALHAPFGAGNAFGLSGLLSRNGALQEALQETGDPNLTLIARGATPPDAAALLGGPLFRTILDDLLDRYDLVVVDAPAISSGADAELIASSVKGSILVVEARRCRLGHARAALARLAAVDARIVGAVLTKSDPHGTARHSG